MSHFFKSVAIYLRSSSSNLIKNTDDKSFPMQLAPSDIHFLAGYNQQSYKPDQNLLTALVNRASTFKFMTSKSNKIHENKINNNNNNEYQLNKLLPKIQVSECKGAWFALNNSHLHVFRELERQGKCARIQVDVVPLSKVPKFVQDSMVVQLPTKPDLITWDQDENETQEDENRPLLVHHAKLGETQSSGEAVNDYEILKDDLKKSCRNTSKIAESCCNWVEQLKQIEQGEKHNANEEQEMMELEPVLFAHQGSGKVNKQGYHQLGDGGAGSSPDDSVLPYKTTFRADSERMGTDLSDYDLEGAGDSDSEYDESLTCNVCDRSFSCEEKLIQHQQRKRHYGCSVCDSIFPNLMTLELHKESLEHWSDGDDAGFRDVDEDDDDDDGDDDEDDDDDFESQAEELERLL